MTKQCIRSYSYSLLLHRNNTIVTQTQYMFFGNQGQISDGWDNRREQKYTGGTVITIY
jgi:hypothetical protein